MKMAVTKEEAQGMKDQDEEEGWATRGTMKSKRSMEEDEDGEDENKE